mmetsp:Transcript_27406/g.58233  ORF Transcript_27406/g.58233 Transcript_27406/m.58233 type:complete len:241 (+) Transcript_27406:587-1309(+)
MEVFLSSLKSIDRFGLMGDGETEHFLSWCQTCLLSGSLYISFPGNVGGRSHRSAFDTFAEGDKGASPKVLLRWLGARSSKLPEEDEPPKIKTVPWDSSHKDLQAPKVSGLPPRDSPGPGPRLPELSRVRTAGDVPPNCRPAPLVPKLNPNLDFSMEGFISTHSQRISSKASSQQSDSALPLVSSPPQMSIWAVAPPLRSNVAQWLKRHEGADPCVKGLFQEPLLLLLLLGDGSMKLQTSP